VWPQGTSKTLPDPASVVEAAMISGVKVVLQYIYAMLCLLLSVRQAVHSDFVSKWVCNLVYFNSVYVFNS